MFFFAMADLVLTKRNKSSGFPFKWSCWSCDITSWPGRPVGGPGGRRRCGTSCWV